MWYKMFSEIDFITMFATVLVIKIQGQGRQQQGGENQVEMLHNCEYVLNSSEEEEKTAIELVGILQHKKPL